MPSTQIDPRAKALEDSDMILPTADLQRVKDALEANGVESAILDRVAQRAYLPNSPTAKIGG